MIDIDKIYDLTKKHYNNAKKNFAYNESRMLKAADAAISNVIPGYNSNMMDFEKYEKDNFAVLFIDMRGSTKRAIALGPEKTFLTMHAYIPAMLATVQEHKGTVIDIMGDGIMVFFGGKHSNIAKSIAVQSAGLCGKDMLVVKDQVVNQILKEDGILRPIDCGIGIDYGDIIVTKIGLNNIFDVKAFGDCINIASKYSAVTNNVKVSKRVKEHWPSSKTGTLTFYGNDNDGYKLLKE